MKKPGYLEAGTDDRDALSKRDRSVKSGMSGRLIDTSFRIRYESSSLTFRSFIFYFSLPFRLSTG